MFNLPPQIDRVYIYLRGIIKEDIAAICLAVAGEEESRTTGKYLGRHYAIKR